MSNNKEIIPVGDIQRGDIVTYIDPKNGRNSKGIVYNRRANSATGKITGLRILPVQVYGKNRTAATPKDIKTWLAEKPHLIIAFGGDPAKNKATIFYNITDVKITPEHTGLDREDHIQKIGTIESSNDLAGVYQHVKKLYRNGELHLNGNPVDAPEQVRILDKESTLEARREDKNARDRAIGQLAKGDTGGETFFKITLTQDFNTMSLSKALEDNHVTALTANIVSEVLKQSPDNIKLENVFNLVGSESGRMKILNLRGHHKQTERGKEFLPIAQQVIIDISTAKRNLLGLSNT